MTEEKKQKQLGAQRLTPGLIDAVTKLEELVRVHGLKVLPPRALEVIGAGAPTRAKLLEAAVRILLDESNGKMLEPMRIPAAPFDGVPLMPVDDRPREPKDHRMITVMYGGPPPFGVFGSTTGVSVVSADADDAPSGKKEGK